MEFPLFYLLSPRNINQVKLLKSDCKLNSENSFVTNADNCHYACNLLKQSTLFLRKVFVL